MTSNGFTIENPEPNRIRAIAVKHGLIAAKRGFRLNRAYTPANCRRAAEELTGKTFKPRDYDSMIEALDNYLNPGNHNAN